MNPRQTPKKKTFSSDSDSVTGQLQLASPLDSTGKPSRFMFWNCLHCLSAPTSFHDFFEGKNLIYVKFALKFFPSVLTDTISSESDIESTGNEFLSRKSSSKSRLVVIFTYISIKALINSQESLY